MSPDSSGRDRELQRQLGVATPALHDLIDVFYDDYDAKNWGFSRFGSLTDRTRALVTDQVLSSADGVVVALREMGLHERAFNRLLGPNGRTMPGPETTPEEYAEMHELPMHSVGALRALGSALDCLTAVCIGVLGVQSSIHGAAASALFQPFAAPQGAAQGQVAAAQRINDVVGSPDCLCALRSLSPVWCGLNRTSAASPGFRTWTGLLLPTRRQGCGSRSRFR
jgi:hypothetical protein